jgi:hypothetical protein
VETVGPNTPGYTVRVEVEPADSDPPPAARVQPADSDPDPGIRIETAGPNTPGYTVRVEVEPADSDPPPAARVQVETAGTDATPAMQLDSGTSPHNRQHEATTVGSMPVLIYLSDATIQGQVETAVEQWLSTVDMSVDMHGEP